MSVTGDGARGDGAAANSIAPAITQPASDSELVALVGFLACALCHLCGGYLFSGNACWIDALRMRARNQASVNRTSV